MSEKVKCRYCGSEMELLEVYAYELCGDRPYKNYRCCECGAESPTVGVREDALLAANRRPPNPPLTKEQIMGMPGDDAVWWVWFNKLGEHRTTVLSANNSLTNILDRGPVPLMFAAKPTPADIEAARLQSGCNNVATDTERNDTTSV